MIKRVRTTFQEIQYLIDHVIYGSRNFQYFISKRNNNIAFIRTINNYGISSKKYVWFLFKYKVLKIQHHLLTKPIYTGNLISEWIHWSESLMLKRKRKKKNRKKRKKRENSLGGNQSESFFTLPILIYLNPCISFRCESVRIHT